MTSKMLRASGYIAQPLWSILSNIPMLRPLHYHNIIYMRAIISRGLYIFYPISFVFREVFKKIMSLCMASIQEWFVIKSGL